MNETKQIFKNNEVAQPSNRIEQKEPIILLDDLEKKGSVKLTKTQGILTSNLRTRKSSNTPYMAFFRPFRDCEEHTIEKCEASKCQKCEIPVVFRLKPCEYKDCQCHTYKPSLKKSDRVVLEGEFANSQKSNRPSFTCSAYEIISHGNS